MTSGDRGRRPRLFAAAGLLAIALAGGAVTGGAEAQADDRAGAGSADSVPTARAARRTGPVDVDGRITEEAWRAAPVIDGFVQSDPDEGAPPAQPTRVRFLYDDDAIYVAARMVEPDPSVIRDQLVRRDQEGQYDFIELSIDPNLDRRTGYLFRLGASGVERDAFLFEDTQEDVDFDAVWSSATHRDSAGWSAEMRIPLSEVQFESTDSAQTWGVNFTRRRLASNSTSQFSLVSRTVEGTVSQFGLLEGIDLDAGPHFVQLEPFIAPDLVTQSSVDPANPFAEAEDPGFTAGLDASYGVNSNFTLDATINPDFGETEVDPAVVNLSAFETFFSEKRPFFVQEFRVFDFDLGSRRGDLLFTRRIGRQDLQGRAPEDADFTSRPDRNTILGAAKFTGRTDGGLSVGVLGALTQEESGDAFFGETGETRTFVAQPQVGAGAFRLRQDLRDGATTVGLIGTAMHRGLPDDGSQDHLPADAFSFGVDFEHEWGGSRNRKWRLSGYWAGSHVRGDSAAMIDLQTNSQHFFQRPDADDLAVDSTATHMTGANWELEFARQSAEHLTWSVSVEEVTPDFAINELGFMTQGEQIDLNGFATWQEIEPDALFRNWAIRFFSFHEFRHELLDDVWSADQWARAYKGGQFDLSFRGELQNNWTVDVGVEYGPEALSDTETRGGPLMTDPSSFGVEAEVGTDPRRTVSVEAEAGYTQRGSDGGDDLELSTELTVRPSPAWELSVEPTYERNRDASQFVTSTGDVGFGPTFGRRHIFSDLEREQVSMETRLELTFSPDLSLQFFGQPLVSANDFATYKQLARPRSFDFNRFEEGRPEVEAGEVVACEGGRTCERDGTRFVDFEGDGEVDFSFAEETFNLRSFVGNAILRWEYMSGSELFLVWRQDRGGAGTVGDFDLGRDLDALLEADSQNRFILKVRHFLDL